MWWSFKGAVARRLGYVAVGLALALLSHFAHSQACGNISTLWSGCTFASTAGNYSSPDAANSACVSAEVAGCSPGSAGCHYVVTGSCTFNSGTLATCHFMDAGGNVGDLMYTGSGPVGASLPNQDILAAISASSFNSGGIICVAGCGYTNSASSMHIGAGSLGLVGQAVPTGAACTAGSGSTAALATANCVENGGTTVCHQPAANVATVNNDIINPRALPPAGQCAGYASGAIECNAGAGGTTPIVQPPTTAGAVDTPTAVVTTTSNTIDYFSGAQVAASATPVATHNGGSVSGNPSGTTVVGPCTPSAAGVTPVVTCSGTSTSGTGTSGTGPGDCTPPADCAGDSTVPSLGRSDTIQSDVQDYWNAVQAAPIVAAFSTISGAWPTATCPTVPFSIAMFHGTSTFDAMAPVCSIWGTTVAPTLSVVFLALWAVAGIRVILSA